MDSEQKIKPDLKALQKIPDGIFSVCLIKPVERLFLPLILRLPIGPNTWTVLTFAASLAAACALAQREWLWAAGLLYVSLILDGFDGDVARYRDRCSFGGAWLDRFLDRVSEVVLLAAYGRAFELNVLMLFGLTLPYLYYHALAGTILPMTGVFRDAAVPVKRRIDWRFGRDSFVFALIAAALLRRADVALFWIAGHALFSAGVEQLEFRRTRRDVQLMGWRHLVERLIMMTLLWFACMFVPVLPVWIYPLIALSEWIAYYARADFILSLSAYKNVMPAEIWRARAEAADLAFLRRLGPAALIGRNSP